MILRGVAWGYTPPINMQRVRKLLEMEELGGLHDAKECTTASKCRGCRDVIGRKELTGIVAADIRESNTSSLVFQ